jgi:hypothetical protein
MKLKLFTPRLSLISILLLVLSGCGEPEGGSGSRSTTSNANSLKTPSVNLEVDGNDVRLNWSKSNADQYRILYWEGNETPREFVTSDTEYMFPPLASGTYTVVVEAYDVLGNSLFSMPVMLEVL